ncbi:MAG: gamma-glutamyl-gamma-aminobutyrate hydrolase family protein [Nitrospirales bacterium]
MREVESPNYPEQRDAISHDWMKYFSHFDVLPFLIPNSFSQTQVLLNEIQPDVVFLTNGEDISGNQNPTNLTGDCLTCLRDSVEVKLLDYAVARKIPVLGVCRGLQFLQVYFGGEPPSLLDDSHDSFERHVSQVHTVKTFESFRRIVQADDFQVNSFHRYGVKSYELAPGLEPCAVSDDGVVEALCHTDLPILAIQWHPERPNPASRQDQRIMHHVLKSAVSVTQ